MCIPHGAMGTKSNGFVPDKKPRKHIQKVTKEEFEKGDPDFIDERKIEDSLKKNEESFLSSICKF